MTFRLSLLLGALITLPFLGSVGLWDPWETHYVEVGRQMLARADLVHPFWEHAYFFSKPPLVPWLSALGLWLSGAQSYGSSSSERLPDHLEWFVRLPVALMLMCAIAFMASSLERLAGRRVALLSALVLWTMPLTCFLARQVMMDGPFVASLIVALSCALTERWAGAFAAMGVALLAKGLLGFLPLVIVPLAWLLTEGRAAWKRVRAVPWWGLPLTLGIGAPWYLAMCRFDGRDEEGRRFFERFFLYDHVERLLAGVHTTTPGGTFVYFIEQGAWALAPWVPLLPLALLGLRAATPDARRALTTWGLTSLVTFALFTSSATRFHHYVFPMLPGLAVLLAFALDHLLEHGLEGKRAPLLLGAALGALVWKDLWQRPRHLLDLFTYNHDRPYPDVVLTSFPLKTAMLVLGALSTLGVLAFLWRGHARGLAGVVVSTAIGFTALMAWQHWPALGQHWTQRELTNHYFAERHEGEPLAAFLMNWKGETLYTRNAVVQISTRDPRNELAAVTAQPGRAFVVVEHQRLAMLQSVLAPGQSMTPVDLTSNNKFALVAVDDPR